MITLSGIYRSPEGSPIPGANIVITSRHNTRETFLQIASSVITGDDASYHIELYPGEYAVTAVYKNGQRTVLGMITLLDDSPDGTLNNYLVESVPELTSPIVLAEVRAAARQAAASADAALTSEQSAAQSESNSASSAAAAALSEQSAARSRDDSASSANASAISAAAALKSQGIAQDAATLAVDTVANNTAGITQLAQQIDAVSSGAVMTSTTLGKSLDQQRIINGTISGQIAQLGQHIADTDANLIAESTDLIAADELITSSLTASTTELSAAIVDLSTALTESTTELSGDISAQSEVTGAVSDRADRAATTAVEAQIINASTLDNLRIVNARLTALENK